MAFPPARGDQDLEGVIWLSGPVSMTVGGCCSSRGLAPPHGDGCLQAGLIVHDPGLAWGGYLLAYALERIQPAQGFDPTLQQKGALRWVILFGDLPHRSIEIQFLQRVEHAVALSQQS
jgi:hypothetical protein